jgi:hypothetical protein
MTPDDFTSALSDRLHRGGFNVLPEDVRSFTTDIGQRITDAPDMDDWAEQYIRARRPTALVAARPLSRAGLGALHGLLFSPIVILLAGGIWGAIARPAPCYGGGEPDMMAGAFFGVLVFGYLLGIPTVIVSTVAGAIIGACLRRRPHGS